MREHCRRAIASLSKSFSDTRRRTTRMSGFRLPLLPSASHEEVPKLQCRRRRWRRHFTVSFSRTKQATAALGRLSTSGALTLLARTWCRGHWPCSVRSRFGGPSVHSFTVCGTPEILQKGSWSASSPRHRCPHQDSR
ncbi:unnamed protein product [Symbiodinium sp. CCMP2456]|nr:unnamed protein product [Symbiodinium sp. CCMP2456]